MRRARQSVGILSAALFSALVFCGEPAAADPVSDTLPPQLDAANSRIDPREIDVTAGPASVTVTLHVTDDLSGFTGNGYVYFYSPTYSQYRYGGGFQLVSGTDLDGEWQVEVEFQPGTESGTWRLGYISLADRVGNQAYWDSDTLESLGLDTAIEVISATDLEPPTLVSFDMDPLTIDTSSDWAYTTLTLELTDAGAGVDPGQTQINLSSPQGTVWRYCGGLEAQSGTPQAGVWTVICWFPRYSQQGEWPVHISLYDAAGNSTYVDPAYLDEQGFPARLVVTSNPSDVTPVELSAFDFLPRFIDTSVGAATVTGTVTASDDISGFSYAYAYFRSPSGNQSRWLPMWQPVAGDALSGTFQGSTSFPRYSEAGTWRLYWLYAYDAVSNLVLLDRDQAAARGFPTVLNVVLPSEESDGQVGSGGGKVEDDVFGERASITLPPGAVGTTTEVAIDVLESQLDFDMPQGFAAPGTRFVNIRFDPVPAMPFPPPGATVVLPLVNPMPAGTPLTLYRVNPVSGELEPAVSVLGGSVTGAVDAGGLSATFTGVGQFSVVVALVADNEPPVVTPPANISVIATESGGATAAAAPALAAFLAGGTATDNLDPAPVRLEPQLGGIDVTSATLFPLGVSTVSFRYQDTAQNVGSATATVTVTAGVPKLSASVTGRSTPAPGQRLVTVKLSNTGNGHARNVTISNIQLRTLAGSGNVTLALPATPIAVGGVDAGGSHDLPLTLNVPATVTRFSITEKGTLKDVTGKSFSFSSSQSVIP